MTDITSKPLDQIEWPDIEYLVSNSVEEGQFIDFKDGRIFEAKGLSRSGREDLAKAVVAFTNAYGGTVIVGIEDKDDLAVSLDHIVDDLSQRTESLERSLRDTIDPPIAGFAVRAIHKDEKSGAIILRVPASVTAPHGFGRPPVCYVRQGKNSNPMSMRDVQSAFWDARTRQERIAAIRAEARADYLKYGPGYKETPEALEYFAPPNQRPFGPGLSFRATAIPQQSFSIDPLPLQEWSNNLRPAAHHLTRKYVSAFGDGSFYPGLARIVSGAKSRQVTHRIVESWSIWANGTVSLGGFHEGHPNGHNQNSQAPGLYAVTAMQIMIMADRLRQYAGYSDVPIELDIDLEHDGTASAFVDNSRWHLGNRKPLMRSANIGPILVGSRSEFNLVAQKIFKEIWAFFGYNNEERFEIDWDTVFK
jgi:Putative DNA-binding domain